MGPGTETFHAQTHIAGKKLFVDYAGRTVPIIDATTGEITQAQIFVATYGASNNTSACATTRQTTADWIGDQVQAQEFFGGVSRLIVPDQARALIRNPDTYDPQPNRLYDEFATHYDSVPHALVRTTVELRVTATLVKCFSSNQRMACHPLSHLRGKHTTTPEYMPASH